MAVVFNLALIEYLIATLEVEVQILLRIGKENYLLAAALPDIGLPILDEFGAKQANRAGGITGQTHACSPEH